MKKLLTILGFIGLISTTYAVEDAAVTHRADLPEDIKMRDFYPFPPPEDINLVADNNNKLEDDSSFTKKNIKIVFDEDNFFPVTTAFSEKLLDDFSEKLLTYKRDELLIYFDSPGGSVFAMSRIIGLMQASNVKFTCITRFAASAAFNMFEACDNRYMLPDGILMSHEWSGAFRGEAPRIMTLFKAIDDLVRQVELNTVSKMNVTMKEYKALINKNLWMSKSLAIKYGAIDSIVTDVSCTKTLIEKRVSKVIQEFGLFGPRNRKTLVNGCPLINKEYESNNSTHNLVYTNERQLRDQIGTHRITFELMKTINGSVK